MNLSIAIVGLPNVGKSTLFNALLKRQVAEAANYPFCTIEPNVGVVEVPDSRLKPLYDLVKKEETKIIPAVVKFVDIAGLVKGASTGEGLGNQFLASIRECQMILEVVRDFSDENVIRAGSISPAEDEATIKTELILKDIETLQKTKNKKQETNNKVDLSRQLVAERLIQGLNQGQLASEVGLTEEEQAAVKDLSLLTMKPIVNVLNVDEDRLSKNDDQNVLISAKVEAELATLSPEEQKEYLSQLGLTGSGLDRVIRVCYQTLGLQTYFTAGPKEVRAWTIRKGAKAPEAAGAIHTDFERGFIAAEVCHYQDYIDAAGWPPAKEKGHVRLEGKDYVLQDGDVVEFRFSV